jgi:predicted nuclease of predicted toxin-antitoxin system
MRFLVDECVGPAVAEWLSSQGQDVFSVYDSARGMEDDAIIEKAFQENWIIVTTDKDFGEQVYRERKSHHGIILLRLDDERTSNKINVLKQLLQSYANQISDRFMVVSEEAIRFAK